VNPVFEFLENYYRPKRQLRFFFMIGGVVLFALVMAFAAKMWIFGIEEVPSYVCGSSDRDYADCVRAYKSQAGDFAEARALASLIPLAIGALFGWAWFPIRNKDSAPLVRLFRERPMDGVWIYPLEIRTKKRGQVRYRQHRLIVGTVQRKKLQIELPGEAIASTMAMFSATLPHATVGYNDQLETQFRANPESLRKPVSQAQAAAAQQQAAPAQPQPYPQQPMPMPGQQPPYPQQGQPYPQHGQPYPQQGQPYPQQGQPYPQQGQPYPQQGQPYPQQGQPSPQQGQPQYPTPGWPPRR
jgi:hypothetical protein